MAFKVFNNREAEAEAARQARLQQKVALQTPAMLAALQPAANTGTGTKPKSGPKNAPLGACFKCGKQGHWARQCPQPRRPTKPCPDSRQLGHWKDACLLRGLPLAPPRGGPASQGADSSLAAPELLRLLDD